MSEVSLKGQKGVPGTPEARSRAGKRPGLKVSSDGQAEWEVMSMALQAEPDPGRLLTLQSART